MSAVRRFLVGDQGDVIPVVIRLDQGLLRDIANAARQHNTRDEDMIWEAPHLRLNNREIGKLMQVINQCWNEYQNGSSHLSRPSTGLKKGKQQNPDDRYAEHADEDRIDIDRSGWKAAMFIPKTRYDFDVLGGDMVSYVKYSGQQVLKRDIQIEFEEEEATAPANEGEEDRDEKPLNVKKTVSATYQKLRITGESMRIVVYVQTRP